MAITTKAEAEALTVEELKAELKARGLPHEGSLLKVVGKQYFQENEVVWAVCVFQNVVSVGCLIHARDALTPALTSATCSWSLERSSRVRAVHGKRRRFIGTLDPSRHLWKVSREERENHDT